MGEELEKTYEVYSKYAKEYAETTFPNLLQYQLTQFTSYLEKGAKIIDVGCGSGKDVDYLTEEGFEVVGIDYSKEMIDEAKERVPNGNFVVQDMAKLEFDDKTFDGVWCCASILHIPKENVFDILKGFNRVLKPEGVMYLAVIEGEGERMVEFPQSKNMPRFFAFYKQREIEELLEGAGFKILTAYTEEDDNHTWINVFCKKAN